GCPRHARSSGRDSAERHRADWRQALGDAFPAPAGVGRKEHAPVLSADCDGVSASAHATRVDVIGEPLWESGRAALPPALLLEPTAVEGRTPAVMAGGRAQDDRIARQSHRTAVVGVKAVILPRPGVATVATDAEAVVGGHEHETGVPGRGMHLVNVVLD